MKVHMKHILTRLSSSFLIAWLIAFATANPAMAQSDSEDWINEFKSIAIQDAGRTMPLETYANNLAVELTNRSRWRDGKGPECYSGRASVQLLCDLLFESGRMVNEPLIIIENRPAKEFLGLDPDTKFFAPMRLAENSVLSEELATIHAMAVDPDFVPSKSQQLLLDIQNRLGVISQFYGGHKLLRISPFGDNPSFLDVGENEMATAPDEVIAAWATFKNAYTTKQNLLQAVQELKTALSVAGTVDGDLARRVEMEVLYNKRNPWISSAFSYGLSIVAFGCAGLFLTRIMTGAGIFFMVGGMGLQVYGLWMRMVILSRPPVTNTFEAILWMGLVAIAIAIIGQIINRKGYYLLGGVIAAELCVLFSMLVPLTDQTNSMPPVLRSNYWLIVHVLVIVASYGVFALAAVLGHVYLIRNVLFARKGETLKPMGHPVIAQTYRALQIGVFLLTVGTILGGVWAADSWGRFWGWDPKETWALISIVIYMILIHARFVGWIKDFGLAMSSIIGFMSIVWTFYGVNYVMASGLHSYGFGAGGEKWVGIWVLAEITLLLGAKIAHNQILANSKAARATKVVTTAPSS